MVELTLRYVDAQRDREGKVKYYHFRRCGIRHKLPGEPFSEQFMAVYQTLLAAATTIAQSLAADRRHFVPGTFRAATNDYLASALFREKAASTKVLYRRVLDALTQAHGDKPLRGLRRRHVRKMRDALADTPGARQQCFAPVKDRAQFRGR